MTNKEQIFKDKYDRGEFKFSYSSMNRLRFSPKLFYKDYGLKDREVRTEKHLIEGRLLHLLLLQPNNFENDFDKLDGISYFDDNYWFNIRGSNTEPKLRLNAEAKNSETLTELINKITNIIEE